MEADSSRAIIPFTGATDRSDYGDGDQELAAVLREIRRHLRTVWREFPCSKERRKFVNRLLLKWHPDKNLERQAFCTTVFQKIKEYVTRLENGEELHSDDEDVDTEVERNSKPTSNKSNAAFNTNYFDNIFNLGRAYSQSKSYSYGDYFAHYQTRPNPQPEEGRRWMRQAVEDLRAAEMTLRNGGSGLYNWSCYQAHQVSVDCNGVLCFKSITTVLVIKVTR